MELDGTIVQCSKGAYYETVWLPFVSFKSIRLGTRRFQKCPVHQRWELARMVTEDEWSEEIVAEAAAHRDSNII
ncbi:hypothetical protein [Brachybacterium alimentarium]|uniref:Uncharacterized protein n=1 Tax=Brachybacterium alimentarium TaxID=47845 RepID=A0A2A3YFD7_9MICO|nr:hypothetical protein [Brachybacterium alimentarium]PCC30813.1 hypothetical protein CIK71_16690 [Brachybacterium alimentarium]PCC38482.1 hypothetical protein CIK66_13730 [Brachybacterium alimentarium]RCS63892.1 hypothetical protein CIK68_17895 [Brachybacterium alimentarium]RCS86423.1 hypothetical protein CIK67_04730 [Brachybacterium alimentarium]RCS87044.1 hypothetical protein CIK69_14705 [Brachybacterium alimentarium]